MDFRLFIAQKLSFKKLIGIAARLSLFGGLFAILFGTISGVLQDCSNDNLVSSRVQGQISGILDADNGNLPKSQDVVKANARKSGFYPDIYYRAYLIGYADELKRIKDKSREAK